MLTQSVSAVVGVLALASGVTLTAAQLTEQNRPSDENTSSSGSAVVATENTRLSVSEPSLVGKPRWELGLGGGYFSGFDYPASKDPNRVALVLPFFLYRSEMWRFAGRGGVGAVAVEKPRIKLDFSLGGSLNAQSSGNSARESMPDLDFLFELGPQLNILLMRKEAALGGVTSLRWYNAARAVISTDVSSAAGRGLLLNSELQFSWRQVASSRVDLQARFRTRWATQDLHDYFYSVPQAFATTQRPAYRAHSGYLGSQLSLGTGFRVSPTLRLFAAVTLENYSGAANEASPLFESSQSTGFAFAAVWTAVRSEATINVFEED